MNTPYMEKIAAQVDEFLAHPTKRVLLLKGHWGVGKTHFWNKIFLPARITTKGRITEDRYAYVSVFGAKTPEDIEQLIVAKSRKTGDRKFYHRAEQGLRQLLSFLDDIPRVKDYMGIVRRFGQMAIHNTLVCIDEVERKAPELSISDVLGIVSILREHNNCRFVIIMNEDLLEKEEQQQLARYREKVIDQAITYNPDIADNATIIFAADEDKDEYIKLFRRLDVDNIRVMQQVKWVIEHFQTHFADLEPIIRQNFKQQLVLLTAFFHIPDLGIKVDNLPRTAILDYLFDNEAGENPEHQKLMERAKTYGYEHQDIDPIIVEYLQNGQCDEPKLTDLLKQANDQERQNHIAAKQEAVWDKYKRSFVNDATAVLSEFTTFLDTYTTQMPYDNLTSCLEVLQQLDVPKETLARWMDIWVEDKIETCRLEDLPELLSKTQTERLKARILERQQQLKRTLSIPTLINKVLNDRGGNPVTVTQLASFSAEDWKRTLLEHDEEMFLATVQAFLDIWKSGNSECKAVVQTASLALNEIAKTSKLNAIRVKMILR